MYVPFIHASQNFMKREEKIFSCLCPGGIVKNSQPGLRPREALKACIVKESGEKLRKYGSKL